MAKIPSPTFIKTGAADIVSGDLGLASRGGDVMRQYVIFELLNVIHDKFEVPQSTPYFPFLVLHMNPESLEESYQKLISRQITRGGYLEQHWGEELDSLSCTVNTGAFVSIGSGLSVLNRKASVAYRKFWDLVALYRNDGAVYDGRGNLILHGGVNMHFDSNIYYGYFENLDVNESGENPYTFSVNFTFKVKKSIRTVGS